MVEIQSPLLRNHDQKCILAWSLYLKGDGHAGISQDFIAHF